MRRIPIVLTARSVLPSIVCLSTIHGHHEILNALTSPSMSAILFFLVFSQVI